MERDERILVERLSAEEIASMDGHVQVVALGEVCAEISAIGKASKMARHLVNDARKALNLHPGEARYKNALLDAVVIQDDLKDRVRILRDYKSIIQTILRGTPV